MTTQTEHGDVAELLTQNTSSRRRSVRLLWERDILITPAVYPSVPMNRNLARFQMTAAHTDEDFDYAIRALEDVWAATRPGAPAMSVSLAGGC